MPRILLLVVVAMLLVVLLLLVVVVVVLLLLSLLDSSSCSISIAADSFLSKSSLPDSSSLDKTMCVQ